MTPLADLQNDGVLARQIFQCDQPLSMANFEQLRGLFWSEFRQWRLRNLEALHRLNDQLANELWEQLREKKP